MKTEVLKYLNANGYKSGDRLLLAVSGGVDSMLLWEIIHQLEIDYAVAHVNFMLRGKESDSDQLMIEKVAKVRSTKLFTTKESAETKSQETGDSIQMAAREIRYSWFNELLEKHQIKFLCTAHHLNDSIETLLLNLNRGTSIKGLTGIKSHNNLMRPLSNFTKHEIRDYAEETDLFYREDASNRNNKYKRNWIRNILIEEWKKQNPSFEYTMAKNIDRFRIVEQVYTKAIELDLVELKKELEKGYLSIKSIYSLNYLEESLFHLLSPLGFSESQVQNLITGIENNGTGLILKAENYFLNLDRAKVYISQSNEKNNEEEGVILRYQNELSTPLKMQFDIISTDEVSFSNNLKEQYFDLAKLSFPLKLRKWSSGDKMKPLGMKGQKKISDILVDMKVPLIEKENCFVLESNQKIVWLVGYKVSEEFKIDSNTKQVIKMKLHGQAK